MYNAYVILWGADIRWIFKSNPRVASFKKHAQHLFPKRRSTDFFTPNFTLFCKLLIVLIALFEFAAESFMEIWYFIGAEECPVLAFNCSDDEKIRNPVSSIHIMSTPSIITCIFS